MLLAKGSAVVAGSIPDTAMANTQIKVIRSFLLAGKPTKVGSVVELPGNLASELIAMGKAKKHDAKAKAEVAAPAPELDAPKETGK